MKTTTKSRGKTRTTVSEGRTVRVFACCHRLPKFCNCPPGARPTCPICGGDEAVGQHYPTVNCDEVAQ